MKALSHPKNTKAYELILARGYPCLRGTPDSIEPISKFGLEAGERVISIGETRPKESSGSRQDRFKTYVEYLGIITIQETEFMIFSSPQDTGIYLLYQFSDEEIFISDPLHLTIRIYKPIFERYKVK